MGSPAQHDPGNHVGWLAAAVAGAFSLARALVGRKPAPPDIEESELEAAAVRAGHRAVMLQRLEQLEDRAALNRSAIERLEQIVEQQGDDLHRALKDAERRLCQRIDDSRS